MNLRQLRYFLAVADAGHITRAARQLGLQQPPLSQQIKALEGRLGLQLFERHPRGVALTDAGRLLQTEARRLVQAAAELERRMTQLARGVAGRLPLAFTSSAAAHAFVPRTLRACRQMHPQIALDISESSAVEITEGLLARRLDCGLLRVPTGVFDELAFEVLFREPVMVVLPSDHPLAPPPGQPPRALSVIELRDEGFILVRRPGEPGLYANLLRLCEERGFRPRIAAEVPRMLTNLNLVAAGAGVSIVPASMVGHQSAAVAYCPLADPGSLDAPMTLAWRRVDRAGPTATFVGLAREMARQAAEAARLPPRLSPP